MDAKRAVANRRKEPQFDNSPGNFDPVPGISFGRAKPGPTFTNDASCRIIRWPSPEPLPNHNRHPSTNDCARGHIPGMTNVQLISEIVGEHFGHSRRREVVKTAFRNPIANISTFFPSGSRVYDMTNRC